MTLHDRCAAYATAFPQFPASHLHVVQEQGRDVLYGMWLLGNDYRTQSALYGAYPKGYLARVMALFPDAGDQVLHAFSGSLPPGPYSRIDLIDRCGAPDLRFHRMDVCALATDYPEWSGRFQLVCADPPYSGPDADKYGTPMVDRRRALAALAGVTAPGRFIVWLDCVWPMHRKEQWLTVGRVLLDELLDDATTDAPNPEPLWNVAGRIGLVRSTNHRVRLVSIFERTAA